MKKITQLILVLFFFYSPKAFAQTKLPLFFSDSMVLQRQAQVNVWGTDNPNTNVTISASWGTSSTATTNAQGKWKLKLQTPAAGGPYTVTITGTLTIVLKGVMIGEVWFCSGQSNMEMPLKGYLTATPPQLVDSADYFIANSRNINIRYFKSAWNPVSRTPLETLNSPGFWESASPENTPDWSATAYFFGRRLQAELGVPIGLMYTARGGSTIESWMDSLTLSTVKPVVLPAVLDWQTAHATPTMMYNTFLYPYIGYTIKGIIWSQGEANRANNNEYLELFTKLINSWRTQWGIGKFPFYFAEVAPRGASTDVNSALIREAQLSTMLTVDSTGMGSTMDIGNQPTDHYPKKKVIGDRLAQWALVKNYNKNYIPSGPIYKNHTISGNIVKLKFDYTGTGLTSFGNTLTDFEVAGTNKVFVAATATIADNNTSVNVSSATVSSPKYVRYAFKNAVIGTLFNTNGLPAPSFRTEELSILLPASLGEFKVVNLNNNRLVSWNVFQETNVLRYELQVSTNATSFSTIQQFSPKGSNSKYEYLDVAKPLSNVLYYRIKIIDADGKVEYSSVIQFIAKQSLIFSILNVSDNNLQILINEVFTGNIMIVNSVGQKLVEKELNNQTGAMQIRIPGRYKGVVFVKIISSDNKQVTKQTIIL